MQIFIDLKAWKCLIISAVKYDFENNVTQKTFS